MSKVMIRQLPVSRAKSSWARRPIKLYHRVTSAPVPATGTDADKEALCICMFCGTCSQVPSFILDGDMFAAAARADRATEDDQCVRCEKCRRPGGMINLADAGPTGQLPFSRNIMMKWHANGRKIGQDEWPEAEIDHNFHCAMPRKVQIHRALMLGYEIDR